VSSFFQHHQTRKVLRIAHFSSCCEMLLSVVLVLRHANADETYNSSGHQRYLARSQNEV
jgi:hypothetical protein